MLDSTPGSPEAYYIGSPRAVSDSSGLGNRQATEQGHGTTEPDTAMKELDALVKGPEQVCKLLPQPAGARPGGPEPPATSTGAAGGAAHDGITASLHDEFPGDELTDDELVLNALRHLQVQGIGAPQLYGNASAKAMKRALAVRGISIPRKRIQELIRTDAMS